MKLCARWRWGRISGGAPGGARRGDGGASDFNDRRVGQAASKRAPMGSLRILIENTAGMGSAVGRVWKRLERFWRGCGICQSVLAWIPHTSCRGIRHQERGRTRFDHRSDREFDRAGERAGFSCERFEDPTRRRVDRHEHIGKGKIGAEAFERILRHPRFGTTGPEGLAGRAFIAETPIDDPGDDRRNVAALWNWRG